MDDIIIYALFVLFALPFFVFVLLVFFIDMLENVIGIHISNTINDWLRRRR